MAEKTHCEICNENFKDETALAMHTNAKHKYPEEVESKGSNKMLLWFIIGFFVIAAVIYFGFGRASGNAVNTNIGNGDVQKLTISFRNSNYYPRTITVRQNVPVEITLDSSVGGCFRSFNIQALGISQYSANPADTIKFTPTQKGSFQFACGMHMGTGTIVVE